jgi:uncharacterized protein YhaN
MRIDHLHLERYGIFSDRKLSFNPEAVLHIVLGANEAGKTSALSAIGDFIFGFGGRTTYDFKHDSKLLRIGGGLRHSDGRTVIARRRKGNKNTLIGENDEPLPDDLFDPFTAGITRDIFLREFGLTAEALRIGGGELLNAGGRLAETLAASSAGMSALSGLTAQLKSEADALFTPKRSSNKPFYTAMDRRDETDQRLRNAVVTRDAIEQAGEAFDSASHHLDTLNEKHDVLGKSLALRQRALRVRQILSRLDILESELSASADVGDASESQIVEWRKALAQLEEHRWQIAVLDEAEAKDAVEREALSVDEGLLSEGTAIDALRVRLGAVRKAAEDLPRRRQARDAAATSLDDAARKLALSSHTDVLTKLPSEMALAQARDLINKRKGAEFAFTEADRRCARLQKERDEHDAQDQNVHLKDVDQLRQRFEAIGDVAAQAERLLREHAALAIEADSISAGSLSLTPSAGALENLRSRPFPDAAVIASYTEQYARIDDDLTAAESAIAAGVKAIAAAEAELVRLSREGATVTRDDLSRARLVRNDAFTELKASLNGNPDQRALHLDSFWRSLQTIDMVTDQLLADTQRATRLADVRSRLEESRRAAEALVTLRDDLRSKQSVLNAAWHQLWASSGVTPNTPQAMSRWREKVEALIGRLNACDARKAEIAALEADLVASKGAVVAFLESAGRIADATLPPKVLFREAKMRLDQLVDAWTEARTRSGAKARIARDLVEAEAAKASARELLALYASQWPAAMTGIGLGSGTTAVEADAAMAVWQTVPQIKGSFEREGRSVSSMESDISAFNEDVFDIVDRVAPHLRGVTGEESLEHLVAALDKVRRSAEGCRRLEKAAIERAAKRRSLVEQIEAVNVTLIDARKSVAATGIADLPGALDRVAVRQGLANEQAKLRRELPGIADGLDEAMLREERVGLDLDLLPSHIERDTLQQRQLLAEIEGASADKYQKKANLDALTAGRNAEAAAAERAAANADILSIAESWLRRAAAARLGALAIERHRSKVQDPLVALAGSLFSEATNRAFAGLAIDYDDDDQPTLVTRRSSGETVSIDGLSEGTRDQLFLSLRLALLAQRTSEPVPFIVDDLLTSFDEERTGATLRLLAAAGQKHQIILFTHHRHVAEIGMSISERKIDLIEL